VNNARHQNLFQLLGPASGFAAGAVEAAVSSLTVWRRRKGWSHRLLRSFQFSPFQFSLAMLGSFRGVGSSLQIYFLDEETPAFVPVCGILSFLKLLQF
jgi:hypothetical protein